MSSRIERLADKLYPGEGDFTGYTRVRRDLGPTRRNLGVPHRPAGKRRSVDSVSVPEHPIRSDSDRPRSQVFHRISEGAVEAWAPHLLEARRARKEGLEMKRRGGRRKEGEQKPQKEKKERKRRSRKGGRADAPRREPGKKQKKSPI